MGSSSTPSPEFAAAFLARSGPESVLSFAEFMDLALYHPELGYYRQPRTRVGRGGGTDFYTASSSGSIFAEMISAACVTLLGDETAAREHTFVELGAETHGGVMAGVAHPFAATRTVRLGDTLRLEGNCVVFSNELFDAQPLRRFVRRGEHWRELGVRLSANALHLEELDAFTAPWLPKHAPEGYCFDAPRAAAQLASRIAEQPWKGLFLAFDYGKSFTELATATPAGTTRAYFQHRQSNDLLANPGSQDLTGHVCWDWLEEALRPGGFTSARIESQEAFFVHHAGAFLKQALAREAAAVSQRKLALIQLLHPSNMGQKFQVLHARR